MARKSSAQRKKEKEQNGNPDALLDEVLGAEPADEDFVDEGESNEEEDQYATSTEEVEADEEKEPLGDDDDGEPPADVEAEGEVEGSDDEDDESQDSESESDASTNGRKDERSGLISDLQTMRRKNAELIAQLNARTPPAPAATTAVEQQAPNNQLPVQVSQDGKEVYIDLSDPRVQEMVQTQSRAANQPTPDQLRNQALSQATMEYSSRSEDNANVVSRAKEVDDYLTSAVEGLMLEGHRFQSISHVIGQLQADGVDKKIGEVYPEVEAMLPEFVEAMASGNPSWRNSVYDRMKGSAPQGETPKTRIKPRAKSPRSMARKGGRRSDGGTPDRREFQALRDSFDKDFLSVPDKDWERMQELGSKLGEPGYE